MYKCPRGTVVKNPPENAEDLGLIPESGRFPGEGNGNPLQYSCLKNSMDRGAWWATVHGSQRVRHDLATKRQQHIYQEPFLSMSVSSHVIPCYL